MEFLERIGMVGRFIWFVVAIPIGMLLFLLLLSGWAYWDFGGLATLKYIVGGVLVFSAVVGFVLGPLGNSWIVFSRNLDSYSGVLVFAAAIVGTIVHFIGLLVPIVGTIVAFFAVSFVYGLIFGVGFFRGILIQIFQFVFHAYYVLSVYVIAVIFSIGGLGHLVNEFNLDRYLELLRRNIGNF